jgi:MFS family permease
LDAEIKKTYVFFVNKERELYVSINSHLHIRQSYDTFNLKSILKEYEELEKISQVAYSITKYIDLNMTALKKILKKWDKKFETYYGNISLKYIQKKLESKNSDLLYILQFKIIDEVSALLEDLMCDLQTKYEARRREIGEISDSKKNKEDTSKTTSHTEKNDALLKIEILEDFSISEKNIIQKINEHVKGLRYNINLIDDHHQNFRNNFKEWSAFLKLNNKTYNNIFSVTNKTSLNGLSVNNINFDDKNNLQFEAVEVKRVKVERPSRGRSNTLDTEILLSSENNNNIYLILLHTFFFMFSFSIVIPTNLYYVKSLGYDTQLSGFVMSCTPIGTLISLIYTNLWLKLSYRQPMVVSVILILLGNLIYIFSSFFGSIIPMVVGRLLIGMGSNRVANRSYLIEYIPKNKLNKYLLYFQLCTLSGLAAGPFVSIFLLYSKMENDNLFNEYNNPSLVCLLISVILMIFIFLQFSEPHQSNFSIYRDGQIISDSERSQSSVSKDNISHKEKIMIEEIDDKLSEINDQNKFSDTNLVARSIEQIAWREKKTTSYLYKCFFVFVLIVTVCRLTTESLLIITPFYIHDLDPDFSRKGIALLISCGLFLIIPMGFLFNNYLSYRIKDRRMLIYLLLSTIIFNALILNIFYTSIVQYCIMFILLTISSNLLESMATTMFSKIIPSDYEIWSYNAGYIIQFFTTIGRIFGSLMLTLAGFASDENLNLITYGITLGLFIIALAVSVYYYSYLRVKAIARILRGRSMRKLKNSEFS